MKTKYLFIIFTMFLSANTTFAQEINKNIVDSLHNEYSTAQDDYNRIRDEYKFLSQQLTEMKNKLDQAKTKCENAKKEYEKAQKEFEKGRMNPSNPEKDETPDINSSVTPIGDNQNSDNIEEMKKDLLKLKKINENKYI